MNGRVTGKLDRIPTTHETSLDMSFIQALSQQSAPVRMPSGHLVRIDVHFLGGGRHFDLWEVADIGVMVIYREGDNRVRTKVALLQSKRLYPIEQDFDENTPLDYMMGFRRLHESDEDFLRVSNSRRFSRLKGSRYAAMRVGDEQWKAIKGYEQRWAIPVYYNLYHPSSISWRVTFPVDSNARKKPGDVKVGCRVLPASHVREALAKKANGYTPSYGDLNDSAACAIQRDGVGPGWRPQEFFADELQICNTGYVAGSWSDGGLNAVFTQRGAPVSAAITITVSAPEDAEQRLS